MERELNMRRTCGNVPVNADQLDVPEDVLSAAYRMGMITSHERAARHFTLNDFFARFVQHEEQIAQRVKETLGRASQ